MSMLRIETTYAIVKWMLLGAVVLVGAAVSVLAYLTQYTQYIMSSPGRFIVETVALGTAGALPIFLISHNRHDLSLHTILDAGLLAFKFMAFWVIIELTGTNAVFFRHKQRPGHGTAM